jgi:hypothetical protein
MAKSGKSKKESKKKSKSGGGKNGKADLKSSLDSGSGNNGVLSKARVPIAATGAVLVGAAAAVISKSRKSQKSRLLRKGKPSNPVLSAAGDGARKLKDLSPKS